MIFFFITLAMNFGISWLNARTAGKIWSESKAVGGMLRFHAIMAYALAILGFTMVYGVLIIMAVPYVAPLVLDIDPESLWVATQLANDMLFILISIFIIPLGYYAWVTSFIAFWRKRSLANGLTLGWNTFANIRNTITVARHAPSAMRRIADVFVKSGAKSGKGIVIAIAVFAIVMAVVGGWLTASAIMHRADEEHDFFEGMQPQGDPEVQR
jgi:hypothetical protein